MTYQKAAIINQIREQESQLYQELKEGKLTIEVYLKRGKEIDQLCLNFGEVFYSLGDLENRLLEVMDVDDVKVMVEHRRKAAAFAESHGMTSRFIYIAYDELIYVPVGEPDYERQIHVGFRLSVYNQQYVVTQFPNFEEIAKYWKLEKLEDFLEEVENASKPSLNDER